MHPFLKAAQEITVIIAAGVAAPKSPMTVDTVARRIVIQSTSEMVTAIPSRSKTQMQLPAIKGTAASAHFNKEWRELVANDLDIEFDPQWSLRDQFSNLTSSNAIEAGERRACFDQLGRKMILIGTHYGTVVVFQQDAEVGKDIYKCAAPSFLVQMGVFSQGNNNAAFMEYLIGRGEGQPNVGTMIPA